MLKRLLLLPILCCCALSAQTLSLSNAATPPAGGYSPNGTATLNITKAGNATATALQFDLSDTPGIASITLALGPAVPSGSKAVSCGTVMPIRCLMAGLNQTPIPDGVIATATVVLGPTFTTSTVSVTMASPVESDAGGVSIPTTIGNPTVSLLIKNGCDVNGDGSVGSADLSQVASAVTQKSTSSATDLNRDGATNVLDAQIVATAATAPFTCNAK